MQWKVLQWKKRVKLKGSTARLDWLSHLRQNIGGKKISLSLPCLVTLLCHNVTSFPKSAQNFLEHHVGSCFVVYRLFIPEWNTATVDHPTQDICIERRNRLEDLTWRTETSQVLLKSMAVTQALIPLLVHKELFFLFTPSKKVLSKHVHSEKCTSLSNASSSSIAALREGCSRSL